MWIPVGRAAAFSASRKCRRAVRFDTYLNAVVAKRCSSVAFAMRIVAQAGSPARMLNQNIASHCDQHSREPCEVECSRRRERVRVLQRSTPASEGAVYTVTGTSDTANYPSRAPNRRMAKPADFYYPPPDPGLFPRAERISAQLLMRRGAPMRIKKQKQPRISRISVFQEWSRP